jgi:predicted peroxiredoxin
MANRILHVVASAYRATLEEQDDPALWLAQSLRNNGLDVHVLLRGNAVNYAVRGQDASGLVFGDRAQTQPPRLEEDLARLLRSGTKVYLAEDDLGPRGIKASELIEGITPVRVGGLPALFAEFEQVWQW